MKQIYLDTFKLHDYQGSPEYYFNPRIEGLDMPDLRLGSNELPAQNGAIVGNHLYGGRLITLRGRIRAGSVAIYRQRRRALEQAVGIRTSGGSVRSRIFKVVTLDELTLQTEVYTRRFKMDEQYMNHGEFSLELFAPDYRLLSASELVREITIFSGGGWAVPLDLTSGAGADAFDMSEASTPASNLEIVNSGNAPASPNILFVGQMEDPTLLNVTTGEQMSFNYDLLSGDYFEVDTKLRTVKHIDGSTITNAQQYFSGTFFTLVPGANVLKLSVTSNSASARVYVRYRDSYIGI